MTLEEKLSHLISLKEDDLRQKVLIPLFLAKGFKDVFDSHGSSEKGKDIVFNSTNGFNEKEYTAVVIKAEKIHGSLGKSGNVLDIIQKQVLLAFNEPFTSPYECKQININKCIVITSNEIVPSSVESVIGTLKSQNLDKLVRFYDGTWLVGQIDQFLPSYFTELSQKREDVLNQLQKENALLNEQKNKSIGVILKLGRQYEIPPYVLGTATLSISSAVSDVGLTRTIMSGASSLSPFWDEKISRREIINQFVAEKIINTTMPCPKCSTINFIDFGQSFLVCSKCGNKIF